MLTSLTIKNIVLIDSLHLDLQDGLTTLTGETGAGKSILLDALGLALGKRADAGLVRKGTDKGIVSAVFDLPADHPALQYLEAQDIIVEGQQIIIRRSLSRDGGSKANVNDQPVSIGLLKTLGSELVETHGQFETSGLLDVKNHRQLIDRYGHLHNSLSTVAADYHAWQESQKFLTSAQHRADEAKSQEEFLRHAVDELEKLAPEAGEEDELSQQRQQLMHREKLAEAYNTVMTLFSEDNGLSDQLNKALAALDRISTVGSDAVTNSIDALNRARIEIEDAEGHLERIAGDQDSALNPDEIEERLFALKDCARKHNCQIDDLPEKLTELKEQLLLVDDLEATLNRLEHEVHERKSVYYASAQLLSTARQTVAKDIAAGVMNELPDLKLDKALFQVTVTPHNEESHWTAKGFDQIAFEIATNPGATPGPIHKIASGGELARFMLALKMVLAETSSVPSLIFDEIDSGIGGATADAVGLRLMKLSHQYQIIVVTHSPQIAAKGAHQLQISKSSDDENTITTVCELGDQERLEEIARMISGAQITEEARAAAARLIHNKAA
jgi:DNA repair protein RecN (Recombination protein N)